MTRRWWTWAIPAIGGSLLAVALCLHGSVGGRPAPRTRETSVGGVERRIRSVPAAATGGRSVAPPGRIEPESVLVPESELLDEESREARAEIVREIFWKYRSALSCDDEVAERSLYPLLLLDRESSLACAREEIAGAPTELDRELSKKAEKALLARITESEAR